MDFLMKKPTNSRTTTLTQKSNGLYRKLFEMAQDGILLLDLNTQRVLDMNPALGQLTGYS